MLFCKREIIGVQQHIAAFQQLLHNLRIAADGNALEPIVEIVVVIRQPHRQTLDDEGREILAVSPPLLFRVALYELFIDVPPHKGKGLLFQVFRLRDVQTFHLLADFGLRLRRCAHIPHPAERVHVEREIVELVVINCNR